MKLLPLPLTITILILTANSATSNKTVTCPKNERWVDCGSSNCSEYKCDQKDFGNCKDDCVSKCYCIPDYRRTSQGTCEPTCPCGENEQFDLCSDACENECGKGNQLCMHSCWPGHKCVCKPNFRRNGEGRCVEESQC